MCLLVEVSNMCACLFLSHCDIISIVSVCVYTYMYQLIQYFTYTYTLLYCQVIVNQDKASQQLAALRAHIQQLEVELQEFRSGRMVVSESGSVVMNDMASENTMLRTENDK